MERKPRVLVLGGPLEYVDRRYLENFQRDYEVHVYFTPKTLLFVEGGLD